MKIKFIHTSDVHGYLSARSFTNPEKIENYGLSRVKTLIDEIRSQDNSLVIYIDTGDTLQGSPLATHYAEKEDVSQITKVYQKLGLNLWIPGNHDFNYGHSYLAQAVASFEADTLCANLVLSDALKKELNIKPYAVLEPVDGLRIGVLGLTTQYIPHWELAENIVGMEFLSAMETAQKYVPILKEKEMCDLIVVAYHGGFERDLENDEPHDELTGENESSELINSDLPIDIILTGHQHRALAGEKNGILYTQPGYKADNVGFIEFELFSDKKIISKSAQLISMADYAPSQEIEAMLEDDMKETLKGLNRVAGKLDRSLKIENVTQAQAKGHPYLDFMNQIQMDYMNVNIAATCFFSENAPGLGQTVTMNDLVASYPFDNQIALVEITGEELYEYLEFNSNYFKLNESGDLIVNPAYLEPKKRIFSYDVFSGIDYTYDFSRPVGQRLVELKYQGEKVSPDDKIAFAVNSYRAQGGGDVAVLDGSQIIELSDIGIHQMLFEYMANQGVTPVPQLPGLKSIGYRKIVK